MPAFASQDQVVAALVAICRARRAAGQPANAMYVQPADVNAWLARALGRPMHGDAMVFAAARNAANAIMVAEANPGRLTLHSPLSAVLLRNAGALLPISRVDPRAQPLLEHEHLWSHVQQQTIQKLVTAMAEAESQARLDNWWYGHMPVGMFVNNPEAYRLRVIDDCWDHCMEEKEYADPAGEMDDCANQVTQGRNPLPSSIHPIRTAAGMATEFRIGRLGMAFRDTQVAFRVEGTGAPDRLAWHIERVNGGGMHPQITLPELMLAEGYNVAGTRVSAAALRPRVKWLSKDIWNQSGVCVSRSLFGATAFPLRNTEGKAVLWALDCRGMTGFDTEHWQWGNGVSQTGPWRPGEKCFKEFKPQQIIGHIVIEKLGCEHAGGWRVRIPADARWSAKVSNATDEQRRYIEEELTAWRGTEAHVSGAYDFAAPHPPLQAAQAH